MSTLDKPLSAIDRLRLWHGDPDTFPPITLDDAEEILKLIDRSAVEAPAVVTLPNSTTHDWRRCPCWSCRRYREFRRNYKDD